MSAPTISRTAPTERQINFAVDLAGKRDAKPGIDAEQAKADARTWLTRPAATRKEASDMIDRLLKAPKRVAVVVAPLPAPLSWIPVPEAVKNSKYAIESEILTDAPDRIRRQTYLFVEVKVFRNRRVVRQLIGSPGKFDRWNLPPAVHNQVLAYLEDQGKAYAAMIKFGEVQRCCGTCAAELSVDESIEAAMGPVCRKKWGRR